MKKCIVCLLALIMLISLAACGDQSTALYENNVLKLTFKSVTDKGISFEIKNKTDAELYTELNVGLDGVLVSLSPSGFWIGANSSEEIKLYGDVSGTEHELMSVHGEFYRGSGMAEAFDVCNFALGGSANKADLPSGKELYSDADLGIEYVSSDGRGINLNVANKNAYGVRLVCEDINFTVGGENYEFCNNATTFAVLPPNTQGVFNIELYDMTIFYSPDALESFNASIRLIDPMTGEDLDKISIAYEL